MATRVHTNINFAHSYGGDADTPCPTLTPGTTFIHLTAHTQTSTHEHAPCPQPLNAHAQALGTPTHSNGLTMTGDSRAKACDFHGISPGVTTERVLTRGDAPALRHTQLRSREGSLSWLGSVTCPQPLLLALGAAWEARDQTGLGVGSHETWLSYKGWFTP